MAPRRAFRALGGARKTSAQICALRGAVAPQTQAVPSYAASGQRIVPQVGVFQAKQVIFHPKREDLVLVVTVAGRLVLTDWSEPTRPLKKLVIPAMAVGAAISPSGDLIGSAGADGT